MKYLTFKFEEKIKINDINFDKNKEIKIKLVKNRSLSSYINELLGILDIDNKFIKINYEILDLNLNSNINKPFIIDIIKNNTFDNKNDNFNLKEFNYFFDCIIKVEDKEFKAHKCILAARSKFFKKMKINNLIEINDISIKDFEIIYNWIYYSEINFKIHYLEIFYIIYLANKFQISLLKKQCEDEIINILDENNFKGILFKSYKEINSLNENFVETIINFLIDNPENLTKKLKNFEDDIFNQPGLAILILKTINKKKSKKKRVSFLYNDSSKDNYYNN